MAELGHGIQHSQVTEQQHSSTGGQMKHWKEKCGHNDWQVIATAELSSADILWAVCRLVAALWVSNEVLMMPRQLLLLLLLCCCPATALVSRLTRNKGIKVAENVLWTLFLVRVLCLAPARTSPTRRERESRVFVVPVVPLVVLNNCQLWHRCKTILWLPALSRGRIY